MSYNLQIEQYRKNTTLSASPIELLLQLYDGAINFIEQAKKAMLVKDFYEQNRNLQKTKNILIELIATLDHKNGKEVAANLLQIYTVVENKITEANITSDPEMLDRIKLILLELRSAWSQIKVS